MSWISKTLKRQLQKWLPLQTDDKTLATIAALQERVALLEKQQVETAATAKALEEEAADNDETAGLVKTTEVLSRKLQRLTKVSDARYVELIRLAQAVKWAAAQCIAVVARQDLWPRGMAQGLLGCADACVRSPRASRLPRRGCRC